MDLTQELDLTKMKNITINIPDQYDSVIQKLIELDIVPNRSEAVRTALREYLAVELDNLDHMNKFQKIE